MVNNNYIKKLSNCDGLKRKFETHYKDNNYSIVEFLNLPEISFEEKLYVWEGFSTNEDAVKFLMKIEDLADELIRDAHKNNNFYTVYAVYAAEAGAKYAMRGIDYIRTNDKCKYIRSAMSCILNSAIIFGYTTEERKGIETKTKESILDILRKIYGK